MRESLSALAIPARGREAAPAHVEDLRILSLRQAQLRSEARRRIGRPNAEFIGAVADRVGKNFLTFGELLIAALKKDAVGTLAKLVGRMGLMFVLFMVTFLTMLPPPFCFVGWTAWGILAFMYGQSFTKLGKSIVLRDGHTKRNAAQVTGDILTFLIFIALRAKGIGNLAMIGTIGATDILHPPHTPEPTDTDTDADSEHGGDTASQESDQSKNGYGEGGTPPRLTPPGERGFHIADYAAEWKSVTQIESAIMDARTLIARMDLLQTDINKIVHGLGGAHVAELQTLSSLIGEIKGIAAALKAQLQHLKTIAEEHNQIRDADSKGPIDAMKQRGDMADKQHQYDDAVDEIKKLQGQLTGAYGKLMLSIGRFNTEIAGIQGKLDDATSGGVQKSSQTYPWRGSSGTRHPGEDQPKPPENTVDNSDKLEQLESTELTAIETAKSAIRTLARNFPEFYQQHKVDFDRLVRELNDLQDELKRVARAVSSGGVTNDEYDRVEGIATRIEAKIGSINKLITQTQNEAIAATNGPMRGTDRGSGYPEDNGSKATDMVAQADTRIDSLVRKLIQLDSQGVLDAALKAKLNKLLDLQRELGQMLDKARDPYGRLPAGIDKNPGVSGSDLIAIQTKITEINRLIGEINSALTRSDY